MTTTVPPKKTTSPKATQKAATPPTLVVKADEDPWTTAELDEVRGELETDRDRLVGEITAAERDLATLLADGVDGAGNDQADVGSNSLERDSEMSLAANHRDMLEQTEKALHSIEAGTYGECESCGNPIGKMRLMAFPRATLCMPCKQREERR
ncbi:MAG: TraR/DksA family transcriptional regulator [Nocardioidaceae bacterium]|nr:TraR/DksA family transcriptional regulator [Nocardioidaceae bacterium]